MEINGLKLPSAFVQDLQSGHLLRQRGSWELKRNESAYGEPLETELSHVFESLARIQKETDELPAGYTSLSVEDVEGYTDACGIQVGKFLHLGLLADCLLCCCRRRCSFLSRLSRRPAGAKGYLVGGCLLAKGGTKLHIVHSACSIYQRKAIHQQQNKTSEGDRQVLWRSFLLDQMCSHWSCFLLCQCRHGIKFFDRWRPPATQ
jgi:hypothetical protein